MAGRGWKAGLGIGLAVFIGVGSFQVPCAGQQTTAHSGIVMAQNTEAGETVSGNSEMSERAMSALDDIIRWKKKDSGVNLSEQMFDCDAVRQAGTSGMDWYAFAMGRVGYAENYEAYADEMKKKIIEKYKTDSRLDAQKATEWHRQILTLLAVGADPAQIEDDQGNVINLVADGTYYRSRTAALGTQGINAYIWALLSMDAMRYQVPEDASDTREQILTAILKGQKEDGGFAMGGSSDIDITAMALQALAPYYRLGICLEQSDGSVYDVRKAAEQALQYLSGLQKEDGMVEGAYGSSSESVAQVIMALCCMGINPDTDERFIKNGNSLMDAFMRFQQKDGGFSHEPGKASVSISGEQAACALVAYIRLIKGERSLYDMRPGMDTACRGQINELEQKLAAWDADNADEGTVRNYYEQYMAIPPSERCYVYHSDALLSVIERMELRAGMALNDIQECMGIAQSGNGTITQICTGEKVKNDDSSERIDAASSPQSDGMLIRIIVAGAVVLSGAGVLIVIRRRKKEEDAWDES